MRRIIAYLAVGVILLVLSWEYQRTVAASFITEPIPEEAIRLRVLAHSDSPQDQWLKREVRDEIIKEIASWADQVKTVEEAEEQLQQSLEQLTQLVQEAIEQRGYSYSSEVSYGQIVFPAKLYGNQLYPAGEYQGLLVTIGAGQGDNWWCVLFPPLCFVDFSTGEVLDPDATASAGPADTESLADEESRTDKGSSTETVEVRFFLVELWAKLWGTLKSMFV